MKLTIKNVETLSEDKEKTYSVRTCVKGYYSSTPLFIYSALRLLYHTFFTYFFCIHSFILLDIGCQSTRLTWPRSHGAPDLSSAILSGHMRATLLAKLLRRNEPSAANLGQEKHHPS